MNDPNRLIYGRPLPNNEPLRRMIERYGHRDVFEMLIEEMKQHVPAWKFDTSYRNEAVQRLRSQLADLDRE